MSLRGVSRAALVVFAMLGAAGAARGESLTEALVSAYNSNPQLAAARAALRVTDEDLAEAWSAFRPQISASATYGSTRSRQTRSRFYEVSPLSGQAQIIQPVLPLSGLAALRSADARIEVGRANLVAIEHQVFLTVVGAYLDVLRDQELLAITGEIADSLSTELASNRRRFDEGDISQTDISITQTRLSQVQADHVTAELNLRRSRSAYEEVVGHPPLELVDPGLPSRLPENKEAATVAAVEGNPGLTQARKNEELARVDIGRAEAGFAPSLNVVGTGTQSNDESFEEQRETEYSLQLQLRMPLYEGGGVQSRVRRAKELWSQRRAETVAVERETVRLVADAYDALDTSKDVIAYASQGVDAARAALDGVRKESVEGFRTTFDVLQSEQNLLDAQRRLVIAQRNEIFAGWQVLSAIGAFSAEATELPTAIYDPKPHADDMTSFGSWVSDEPMDPGRVPQPTSTAPLIPPQAVMTPPPPVAAPAAAPAEMQAPAAAPATAEGTFWTDVLGIPADEVELP